MLAGKTSLVDELIVPINKSFALGPITHGPGLLSYLGLNVTQHLYRTVEVDVNDKLAALKHTPSLASGVLKSTIYFIAIEKLALASINSPVG